MIVKDNFSDVADVKLKIYKPYAETYKLSSTEQMIVFQQSSNEVEHSDRLNDRETLKGYCDSTEITGESAVKIGSKFYTMSRPNNIGFQNDLITPFFTERDDPETYEHTVIIPLYLSPGSEWDSVLSVFYSHSTPMYIIANPDNGAGLSIDADYQEYIGLMQANGVKVLGYISTEFGSATDIDEQLANWSDWYAPDGIFFDELSTSISDYSFYEDIVNVSKEYGFDFNVGNSGAIPSQSYYGLFDMIVSAEGETLPSYDSEIEDTAQGCLLYSYSSDLTDVLPKYYYIYTTPDEDFTTIDLDRLEEIFTEIEAYYVS